MMNVIRQQSGQAALLRCSGRLVRGEEAVLQDAVQSTAQARVILLDLAEVTSLDAGGLAALVWSHRWAESRGARLQLVNPSAFVAEMLTRTGLDEVFEVSRFEQALYVLGAHGCQQAQTAGSRA
jgi:anti-anti-sigma factor